MRCARSPHTGPPAVPPADPVEPDLVTLRPVEGDDWRFDPVAFLQGLIVGAAALVLAPMALWRAGF